MPEWFKKLTTENITDKKWLSGKDGVAEGSRNETATSIAGKILSSMDPKLWEALGWEQFQIWNNKNVKPLSEKELGGIWGSIKKYNSEDNSINNAKKNQAEMLLEIVEGKENVKLFHDDKKY